MDINWVTVIVSVLTSTITVCIILNIFTRRILDSISEDIVNWAKEIMTLIK